MGTEVKLKREAIERRIAELEGKMPDIQASKEGAEARATIRRLKANENIETKTLNKLCAALNCKLEDIAEYVKD